MQNNNAVTFALAQFVQILRHLGVRVSVAETMDAYQALNYVDLLDKRQVKGALRALLVKNHQDWLLFNRAFEFFFLPPEEKEECLNRYRQLAAQEEQRLQAAGQELNALLQPWQNYVPKEYLPTPENIQTFARLPARERKRFKEVVAQMRSNPVNNPGELVARVVQAALNYWRYYLLKRQEENQLSSSGDWPAVEADFYRHPGEQILTTDLQKIKDEDLERITALLQRLSARLARRLSRRYRRSHRALALDFRRTLRQSVRYGGVPLELRYRRRRRRQPGFILICDVSASMARYARFVLQFIYGLNSAGLKMESFVFSTDLERITPWWQQKRDFAGTMTALLNNSRQWGQTTNFYHALQTFLREYEHLIAPESILIIVSDTKTVSWEQAAALLAEISKRVKDVLWLNPVPAARWPGLPAVAAFQKSARMFECFNLDQLEKIFRKKLIS